MASAPAWRRARLRVMLPKVTARRTPKDAATAMSELARRLGVGPEIAARALARLPKRPAAAPARIVDKTRTADEFTTALASRVQAPRRELAQTLWDLQRIREARDAQMRGDFKLPVRLAEALRTDDAMFTAYRNRIAPGAAIAAQLKPAPGTRGEAVAKKAAQSVIVPRTVLQGIHGTLANHSIAIGYIEHETSDDGTRVDFKLTEWPLEHVKWNSSTEILETRVRDGGSMVPIVHGNGEWIRFARFSDRPWTQDACVIPAGLAVWAPHAYGVSDWAAASKSHGQAKIFGELPLGVPLQGDAAGSLSAEAQAFLQILVDVLSGDMPAAIRPAGAKTDFVTNTSTAWQVFSELIVSREKAGHRIYNGTDAALGSVGGAPGVDIAALFGVATTIVQGDFECIEQALDTGLWQPWTAINCGDSRLAPSLRYQLPDPDEDQKSEQQRKKRQRLHETLEEMKSDGFTIDQSVVDALAKEYGVHPAPVLASGTKKVTPLALAPTDAAKVVRVREARAAQGLEPFGDARDEMTITELDEANKAKAEAAAKAPAPPTTP